MARVLLVANETLGSLELTEFVKSRMADAGCQFTLLVPATPRSIDGDPPGWASLGADEESQAPTGLTGATEDDYAHARSRLEYGLGLLTSWGAAVDGEVGNPDPAKAIKEALTREHFDEVALSTLPQGVSRWLRLDIPHRVQRKFHIPVTVIRVR